MRLNWHSYASKSSTHLISRLPGKSEACGPRSGDIRRARGDHVDRDAYVLGERALAGFPGLF